MCGSTSSEVAGVIADGLVIEAGGAATGDRSGAVGIAGAVVAVIQFSLEQMLQLEKIELLQQVPQQVRE